MSDPRPSLVILAGPNGAGKSTVAPALLHGALAVNEFVNADVIARGLSAFDPEGVAIAVDRVAERVRAGGHNVPSEVVRRRYRAGLRNFFNLYQPLATAWVLYDNSGPEPRRAAERLESRPLKVYDEVVWAAAKEQGTA